MRFNGVGGMFRVVSSWVLNIGLVLMVLGCDAGSARFANTDITGSALTAQFNLKDLQGQTRTLESYRGKVLVIFFGYMHCPDVCPTTLHDWAVVKDQLGEEGNAVQVVFVTVDPQRDTPELLRNYVPRFDPSFQALHGTEEELKPLLAGLRVLVSKVKPEGNTPSNMYTIDHTAASFVFDPQGKARVLVRYQAEVGAVVRDIKQILNGR